MENKEITKKLSLFLIPSSTPRAHVYMAPFPAPRAYAREGEVYSAPEDRLPTLVNRAIVATSDLVNRRRTPRERDGPEGSEMYATRIGSIRDAIRYSTGPAFS